MSNNYSFNFTLEEHEKKEESIINILVNKLYKLQNIDKLLLLGCNSIITKSLLSLWEINMKDKFFAGFDNISFVREKIENINLNKKFYINDLVLLLNVKKLKNEILISQSSHDNNKDIVFKKNRDILNIFTDTKNFCFLNSESNNNVFILKENYFLNNSKYKEDDKEKKLKSLNYSGINIFWKTNENIFKDEIFKYYSIMNNVKNSQLTVPIVMYSDDENTPFMYTSIISILEYGDQNTYYTFYLLVPNNFSKNNENIILELYNKYKCFIHFIYMREILGKPLIETSNSTTSQYSYLLIGELLPKNIEKCIFLDVNTCVNKDLSELFNIDMKDNYIAGVISPEYYFNQEHNCKRLNLSSIKQYVNSGVLLLNLKYIRNENLTLKFIELSHLNSNFTAQDILNVVCYGKIITLPPKYNALVLRFIKNNPILIDLYKEENIFEAIDEPYIINYYEKKKPWNSIGIFMEKYWWNVAKKTPFINNLFSRENIYKNSLKKFYYMIHKKVLDFDRPKSFNEKIQWLKLYDSTPVKTKLSDKFLVREWINDKIGEEYLIPLIGVYDKFEEIDFEKLPNQFVLKCNHGSAYNIIVKNKAKLNITKAKLIVEKWINENYAFNIGLELQYRDIKPRILIEKFMDDGTGDLRDYKFTCFKGKPLFLWVDSGRHTIHKRNLYDLNWNQLPYKVNTLYSTFPSPKKPKNLKKMVELASILSEDFVYVRVDFYNILDKIYFSEMTFTSSSGIEDIKPDSFERRLASLIKLPKIVYNIDTGKYYRMKN